MFTNCDSQSLSAFWLERFSLPKTETIWEKHLFLGKVVEKFYDSSESNSLSNALVDTSMGHTS